MRINEFTEVLMCAYSLFVCVLKNGNNLCTSCMHATSDIRFTLILDENLGSEFQWKFHRQSGHTARRPKFELRLEW